MLHLRCLLIVLVSVVGCRTAAPADPYAEFGPNGVPIDWGSLRPMSAVPMTAEAKLANAAAVRLNEAARLKELLSGVAQDATVKDGIVTVPVKFLSNDEHGHNHPFGDGQKNASLGWMGWPSESSTVPLVASLAFLEFSQGLTGQLMVLEPSSEMIQMLLGSSPERVSAEISNEQSERLVIGLIKDERRRVYRSVITLGAASATGGTSDYPAMVSRAPDWLSVVADRWAWPRIKVRFFIDQPSEERYWPILFRFPAQSREDAQGSLPLNARTYEGSIKDISLPPYDSSVAAPSAEALKAWLDSYPSSDKPADFYPATSGSGVHNHFTPAGSGSSIPTATGGVDTYVLKKMVGNNQILFTCFDARNPDNEAQWGVPSGAGWHSIGHELPAPHDHPHQWTFAESVINSFEKSGIFAGWGVRTPYPFTEAAPFDAKDITTFRVLRHDEVFTTAKHHFHWYAVDAKQKVCTIIWKHMRCPLKSDRFLDCQNQ
jgi:hypothetical protein